MELGKGCQIAEHKEDLLIVNRCYNKRKVMRNIVIISLFMIIGSIIGVCIIKTQQAQLLDPEYIKFWNDNNMEVPEPMPSNVVIIGFLLLLGGIPTGIIEYAVFFKKYVKTSYIIKPLVILGSVMLFPIYGLVGAVTCIPFLVFEIYLLTFGSKKYIKNS